MTEAEAYVSAVREHQPKSPVYLSRNRYFLLEEGERQYLPADLVKMWIARGQVELIEVRA